MSDTIETERLLLVPVKPEHVEAFFSGRDRLGALLAVKVPDDWPVCPESMEYWREKAGELSGAGGWAGYFFIHKQDGVVAGDGGFKGPPDKNGKAEIGYAIVPAYRRFGLATEAAKALLDWAFTHAEVRCISAETLPGGGGSMRVLEKIGMSYEGTTTDPQEGSVYLWQISREEYSAPPQPESEGCPFS